MNKIATTYQFFKANTGYDGKPDKRGPRIRRIDDAFKEYERNFANSPQAQQIALTLALYTQCKDWMKKKQQKSDYKTRMFQPTTLNQNLITRRTSIGTVAKECLIALREVAAISEAREAFDTRKINMMARGTSAPRPVALSGGYANEKKSWDTSAKTAALAGTKVHGLTGAHARAGTTFDDLSLKEYQRLAALACGQNQVLYFKKDARLGHMVDIDDQGLLCDMQNQPLNWALPALNLKSPMSFLKSLYMYAMDRYGNLFQSEELGGAALAQAATAVGQLGTAMAKYNHSSFNAGRDVICAGLIGIQNGYLVWIDHHSGHYKPSRQNLWEAVTLLNSDGVDLSRTNVGAYNYKAGGAIDSIEVFTAQHFLQDASGQPDVGRI